MGLLASKNTALAAANEVDELEHITVVQHAFRMLCAHHDDSVDFGGYRPV